MVFFQTKSFRLCQEIYFDVKQVCLHVWVFDWYIYNFLTQCSDFPGVGWLHLSADLWSCFFSYHVCASLVAHCSESCPPQPPPNVRMYPRPHRRSRQWRRGRWERRTLPGRWLARRWEMGAQVYMYTCIQVYRYKCIQIYMYTCMHVYSRASMAELMDSEWRDQLFWDWPLSIPGGCKGARWCSGRQGCEGYQ